MHITFVLQHFRLFLHMTFSFIKNIFSIVLMLFVSIKIMAQNNYNTSLFTTSSQNAPKREVRAVWLTTIGGLDWPHNYAQSATSITKQQKELLSILDKLKNAGINMVLFQTRIRGTVIYPSIYEPWDGCTSGFPGKSPGYDPLSFAIQACHDRGMEIQAWIVSIPIGKWNQLGCKSLMKKYPHLVKKIGEEGFLNPEMTETADYLGNLCAEITQNYDIDGIHLDYIRYPETWKINVSKPQARQYISNIVRTVHKKVSALKPWVKLSCSPIGKFNDLSRYYSNGWNAYNRVAQDAQQWLKEGIMDELYPMMYFKGNSYYPFVFDWNENNHGRTIASGLGIYFMDPKEKNWDSNVITRQLQVLRQQNMGYAFFRNKFFLDNTKGIYSFITNNFNQTPTLVPAQTWKNKPLPTAPQAITIDSLKGVLHWKSAINTNDSPYLLYNVYADVSTPVNTNDAGNLIKMRIKDTKINIPTHKKLYYAVTTIDRYGNESLPIQSHSDTIITIKSQDSWLSCKNFIVELPQEWKNKAQIVAVETLQGNIISTYSVSENKVKIDVIPAGTYQLRLLRPHNKGLLIGYFIIGS